MGTWCHKIAREKDTEVPRSESLGVTAEPGGAKLTLFDLDCTPLNYIISMLLLEAKHGIKSAADSLTGIEETAAGR